MQRVWTFWKRDEELKLGLVQLNLKTCRYDKQRSVLPDEESELRLKSTPLARGFPGLESLHAP